MRICHVTPHLPPDQAANALLPYHLGVWARERGDEVAYVAHPPRAGEPAAAPGPVTWLPPVARTGRLGRVLRVDALRAHRNYAKVLAPIVAAADLVHVHSNGLLAETAGLVAGRTGCPVVLTLYGTEIWHYRRKWPVDLFTRLYRRAAHVAFYSRGLLDRADELGLSRPAASVIYPPVADSFVWHDGSTQQAERRRLGLVARNVLVNVKRLHPLAGHRYLLEALPAVLEAHPDTAVVICGAGTLRDELQREAGRLGVDRAVTFTGLVDNALVARYCAAADYFVLPSLLEACPTVAVEALACGTPVISADHPGGVELHTLFGDEVCLVPRRDSTALARAIIEHLHARRRTSAAAAEVLMREFRPAAVASRYWRVYEQVTTHDPA